MVLKFELNMFKTPLYVNTIKLIEINRRPGMASVGNDLVPDDEL